jgi:hypothetical protein
MKVYRITTSFAVCKLFSVVLFRKMMMTQKCTSFYWETPREERTCEKRASAWG